MIDPLAQLIERTDFARTPLGPRASWPQSLRTAVSICLSSKYPMLIWWGPELCMIYNQAYVPILGNKHPAALGHPGRAAWGEIWPVIGPMLRGVMERGEATWSEDELLLMNRKGFVEETYFTWSYSPISDETGGIGGVFTAVTETTARVLGERRLQTLRELGEQVSQARKIPAACNAAITTLARIPRGVPFALLYLLDADARGARLAAHTGIPPGTPASPMHVALDDPKSWPIALSTSTRDDIVVDNVSARFGAIIAGDWPDPIERVLVVPLATSEAHEPFGVLVAGVSPRLPLDTPYRDFLRLAANHIASALASARAYEEERRRAEALAEIDRAKTAFFSNISHELRTPLTLMLGPLQDALAHGSLSGETLTIAHRNALRLLKLVNALLEFSRIEAGRVQASYEPIDLATLTRELAAAFQPALEAAGLAFDVSAQPLPEPVYVDPAMWEKIVLNLLSNAFKFTFEGSVRVGLRAHDGAAELAVSDTGIGIAADQVPKVFERFHRIEGARSRTHEGSGIGLALVHELVRLHGGTITVTSEPGVGSTFTVRVPFGFAHLPQDRIHAMRGQASTAVPAHAFVDEAVSWLADDPTPAPAQTIARRPARILVADDNADMREYICRKLGEHWTVERAADGEAALAAARAQPPDLVISDIMMPGLDGFGLLRELRADPRTAQIPVIFLSARAGDEARAVGIEAGAEDYLIKPFSARELIARVSTHLELASARRAAEEANRAKDEFLAVLGHELRNPLAPIQTALQLMALRGDSRTRERLVIERQVGHLVRLVDDLLDVSRITRGKIELERERVELATIVAEAIEMVSPLIEQKRHGLVVSVPSTGQLVDVDPGRMSQVVSNLLTNAAKYTPAGGEVEVSSHSDGGDIVLQVRDNGIGIPADSIARVFDAFVQDEQALDRARGGLGLGLTIVRNLVELHGGNVSAESGGAGQGSMFTVRLPAAPLVQPADDSQIEGKARVPRVAARRVLVVDDNVDAAELVVATLAALGHEAKAAHDGPTALGLAARMRPHLALLDIGLPVMDGYELARRMRALPELRTVRLIALTGYGTASDRARSLAAGFDEHLVKPLALERLEAVLEATPI